MEYLYKMLGDISEERRQLTIMAREYKARLDDLIRFQMQGLEELDIQGWTDMYNQKKKESAVRNIAREAAYNEERMKLMFERVLEEKLNTSNDRSIEVKKEPFPSMSEITRLQTETENQAKEEEQKENKEVQANQEQVGDKQDVQEQGTKADTTADKHKPSIADIGSLSDEEWRRVQKNLKNKEKKAVQAVEEQSNPKKEDSPAVKEHKTLTNGSKRKAYIRQHDTKHIYSLMTQILKEEGIPLSGDAIYEKVQELYEKPLDKVNFTNNMLFRFAKKEKRVSKPKRGFYQYNFSVKE